MKTTSRFVLLILLAAVCGNAYSAIIYQSDDRFVSHTMGSTYTPDAPYADFDRTYWSFEAGAFQNSSLTSSTMTGSGWTYAGFDAGHYGAWGASVFSVTFGVDQLTDFNLAGSLATDTFVLDGDLSVTLRENGVNIFAFDYWEMLEIGVNPFNFSGQFETGSTYQLVLSSSAYYSDYSEETWNLNLTSAPVVPVPAALWLFGSGLLGLFGFAMRRSARV